MPHILRERGDYCPGRSISSEVPQGPSGGTVAGKPFRLAGRGEAAPRTAATKSEGSNSPETVLSELGSLESDHDPGAQGGSVLQQIRLPSRPLVGVSVEIMRNDLYF
jgi:hypothetical protein